jgi:hypothetical protein
VSKDDLSQDLEALLNTGLFANVDANVTPKVGLCKLNPVYPQLERPWFQPLEL